MPVAVTMPALSPTMTEGTLAKWLVAEGDRVSPGDVIAEIETDKATMEVEAVDEGIVASLAVPEGAEGIEVNATILWLRGEGESADAVPVAEPPPPVVEPPPAVVKAPPAAPARPKAEAAKPALEPDYRGETVEMTVREALRDAMAEEMRRDETVFVMGEEVAEYEGAYKVTQGLLAEFGPRRVRDTPITEHGFAGLGVGAAFGGLRPVVEFMTFNFAMQAIDQIVNSAAKTLYMSGGQMGCPIVFRGPNGAASRVAAQHSQCYASWYAHVPGMIVVSPFSAADAKGLLKAAIRNPNPVIFLENEILYGQRGEVPSDADYTAPIGRAKVLRPGRDVTVVAFSRMCAAALEAADTLAAREIEARLSTFARCARSTGRPWRRRSARRTASFPWRRAGRGRHRLGDRGNRDGRCLRLAGRPGRARDRGRRADALAANLEALALPDAARIAAAARAVCYA